MRLRKQKGGLFKGFTAEMLASAQQSAAKSKRNTGLASVDKAMPTEAEMKVQIAKKVLADKQELARRKDAIKTSDASTGLRDQFKNSAVGDKMRLFPDNPNSFIDEYLNPLKMAGDMADNIGHTFTDPNATVGQKALALGTPLAAGAMGAVDGIPSMNRIKYLKNEADWHIGNFIGETKDKINNFGLKKYHNSMKDYIKNPEVIRRLKLSGMSDEAINAMEIPEFKMIETGSNYDPNYMGIEMGRKDARLLNARGYDMTQKTIYDHEFGHYLQDEMGSRQTKLNALKNSNLRKTYRHLDEQYPDLISLDDYFTATSDKYPMPPSRTRMDPTIFDDIAINLTNKKAGTKQIDDYLYFNYNVEAMAHIREMRSNMIRKGMIKDHISPIDDKTINTFIKNNPRDRVSGFLDTKNPDNMKDLKWLLNNIPAATGVVAGGAATLNQKQKGGSISKMGYRDDSPYRGRKSMTINTPEGLIDMSETGIPLYAEDETGYGKVLEPYSGMHQFRGNKVTESRMQSGGKLAELIGNKSGQQAQQQGLNKKQIFDFIFEEEDKPVAVADPKAEEPEEDDLKTNVNEEDYEPEEYFSEDPAVRHRYRERKQREGEVQLTAYEGTGFQSNNKGEYAYNYLINKGLPKHASAGIVGNYVQESGNFRDDVISGKTKGDSGLATGAAQWHPDRWAKAVEWITSQGKNPYTIEGQLDWTIHEATQRGDLQKVINTSSPEEAAYVFAKHYERPKIIDGNRARYARAHYRQWGGEIYEDLFK